MQSNSIPLTGLNTRWLVTTRLYHLGRVSPGPSWRVPMACYLADPNYPAEQFYLSGWTSPAHPAIRKVSSRQSIGAFYPRASNVLVLPRRSRQLLYEDFSGAHHLCDRTRVASGMADGCSGGTVACPMVDITHARC
ncbi:hypothetical protein CCHR01_10035, partial [Colletotrichum chrysophilum]